MPDDQPERPTGDDRDAWRAYWAAQGIPWRREPGIDAARQAYLAERRDVQPDIERGIYPFRGIYLSRADVEWLLATHDDGRGPIDPYDESDRRQGLDLRGAMLGHADYRLVQKGGVALAYMLDNQYSDGFAFDRITLEQLSAANRQLQQDEEARRRLIVDLSELPLACLMVPPQTGG